MAQDFQLRLITQRAGGGDPIVRERKAAGPDLYVGRAPDNGIVLADLSVELHHAKIRALGDGRVSVESVGLGTFGIGGRTVKTADFNAGSKPEVTFGDYHLSFDVNEAGDIVIVVTRDVADEVASPSIFSLRARFFGRRRMAWIFGAGFLLICLLIPAFGMGLFQGGKIRPDQQWSSGPLSQAHAFLEDDCGACHQKAFVSVRDAACLSCHGPTGEAALAARDDRVKSLGSEFRPVWVAEHAAAGVDVKDVHKRLQKGSPAGKDGFVSRIQAVFNHPDDRCGSCHIEHTKKAGQTNQQAAAGPRQLKPTLITVRECETCHAQLKMRLSDTTLIDTPDWNKHPKFRPLVTRGGGEQPAARMWLSSNPREETGLIFPHDLHLDPLGGPARQAVALGRARRGSSPVTCASCHQRQGEGFKPVVMEDACEACHSLAFTRNSAGRLVSLPHEEPAKVKAFLDANYGGGGGIFRSAFSAGGMCVDCHTISWNGAMPVVAPTHLSQNFMPRGDFNHAIDAHGAKSVDEIVCRDCHKSPALKANPAAPLWRVSSDAHDLLQPDKAQCDTCHGNPKATKADSAPADCKTCHSFHAPGVAACEPNDRGLDVLRWDAKEPARCVKPRRYAAGFRG